MSFLHESNVDSHPHSLLIGFRSDCMFFLFRAFSDHTDYSVLDALQAAGMPDDFYESFQLYGVLMLALYAVLSGILLGNLLIAIITNRYK